MIEGFDVAHIMPIGILAGDSDAMILSSADILRILGGNEIIRLSAKLSITDGRPSLSGREGTYIYVERFPVAKEFEATWSIYIESDEDVDLVVAEIKRLLPKVEIEQGLLTVAKTTDFRSESTQTAPEAPKVKTAQVDLKQYEERFQSLVEDVQDQMLLVHSGRAGKDGQDGRDGVDGRDGKDIDATQTELFDLKDVDQSVLPIEKGQVLTWDGSKWTNLYMRQTMSAGGPVGSTTTEGVPAIGQSIAWKYHHEGGGHEPHSGDFHADNQQTDLTTQFHVSNFNSSHTDVSLLLQELLVTTKRLYISEAGDGSVAHLFDLVSYTQTAEGYELNVSHVETPGPEVDFTDNRIYNFLFLGAAATVPEVLDDLSDVSAQNPAHGDMLVYDSLTSQFVLSQIAGGGGIPDAPNDGNYYVRRFGEWVDLRLALSSLGVAVDEPIDGGNFTTGFSSAGDNNVLDGGNFTTGTSSTTKAGVVDGGDYTSGSSGSTYNP